MCGIFGFFSARSAVDAGQAMFPVALAALAHRGPDDRGSAVATAGEIAVGLAQTRLAILDPSPNGHQPMRGPNGELLVLNGEIYNHLELRPALEAVGVRFLGTSDTETLLHLLMREGSAALERLVGMFALAFWDPASSTLLLARDPLGKKPLYLVEHPHQGLVFASEVRALLATQAAPRVLDPAGLGLWLARGSSRDPTTLIAGVRSLPPGHLLTLGPKGRSERAWWTLPLALPTPDWRPRLAATLDDAVRLRLLSDRPIGVFLSGGVDSAAIAAVAARHARSALEAFTLTFSESAWDEGARARASADRLGLRHHTSHLSAGEALAHMDEALAAQDLPSHDGFNTWFVARAARRHGLVVALAGTGGDELFGGYRHFSRFPAMLRLGALGRVLPAALRQRLLDGLHPAIPTRARKLLALAATAGRPETVYAILREMFPPVAVAQLLGHVPSPAPAEEAPFSTSPHAQLSRLELSRYLVDTQLRDIDAMSMAHGFEVRAPLLDRRLVAEVLAVPREALAPRDGVNKRLLVDLAGLPPEAFRVPKRGFVFPWESWLRGPLAGWIAGHLAPASLAATGALDVRAVGDSVGRFQRGHAGASRVLSLIALSAWCLRHDVRA